MPASHEKEAHPASTFAIKAGTINTVRLPCVCGAALIVAAPFMSGEQAVLGLMSVRGFGSTGRTRARESVEAAKGAGGGNAVHSVALGAPRNAVPAGTCAWTIDVRACSPNLMRESDERAAIADALRLRSQQGSRRTIESPGRNTKADFSQVGGKPLTDDIHCLDRNQGGKNAREKSMQRAAAISAVSVLVTVMMESSLATVVIAVVTMHVRSDCSRETLRARQR
jgi:hypothetical protein